MKPIEPAVICLLILMGATLTLSIIGLVKTYKLARAVRRLRDYQRHLDAVKLTQPDPKEPK